MKKIIFFFTAVVFISSSAWCQAETYKVYALTFAGTKTRMPIGMLTEGGPMNDSVGLEFMVWLIQGKGKNILLDAGFHRDSELAKGFNLGWFVRPDSVLYKLGLKPEDITDIILSHPHFDHVDGIDLFPNAHLWVQKEDYNYFVGTAWQKDGRQMGFEKRDVRKLVEINMAGRLTLVDGDNKEIMPGIKVYTGSRHTFNSQYVLVETGVNKIVLASDNIWIYYSLEHMTPAVSAGTFDQAAYVKAMERMKTLASDKKFIIPGHDARVFSIFPAVTPGVVQIK